MILKNLIKSNDLKEENDDKEIVKNKKRDSNQLEIPKNDQNNINLANKKKTLDFMSELKVKI